MQLAFPPEIEDFVQRQLSSGKYGDSPEKVILAALELLRQQEDIYQGCLLDLQRDARVGIEDLQAGRMVDGPSAIDQIRTKLKAHRQASEG